MRELLKIKYNTEGVIKCHIAVNVEKKLKKRIYIAQIAVITLKKMQK